MIAPTPTLLLTALNDEKLPNTKSCGVAVDSVRSIYKMLGAGSAMDNWEHKAGRTVPVEALDQADAWFERWL